MSTLHPTIHLVSNRIIETISYLLNRDRNDGQSSDTINTDSSAVISKTNDTSFKLLLISSANITNEIKIVLSQNDSLHNKLPENPIAISQFEIEDMGSKAFDKRYDLAVVVDPALVNLESKNTDDISNTDRYSYNLDDKTIISLASRLRDLFAKQSVLFLDPNTTSLNLNDLGFSASTIQIQLTPDAPAHDINSWQFNLYDYKQRPEWLNAKYWANPENFDKYRW